VRSAHYLPRGKRPVANESGLSLGARRARRKFLSWFPDGFKDETYLAWERAYKWAAHLEWERLLTRPIFARLIREGAFQEIAARAVRIEGRTHLLFSFEKMALRDAVRDRKSARAFAEGLFEFLHGRGSPAGKFDRWCATVAALPRRQTRVLTWPIVTVFGFLADPDHHVYFKPMVTRRAARSYGFDLGYVSRPSAAGYLRLLDFAARIGRDLRDLRPRDMIDLQSFIWVQGSEEYD
jgi:hypothetical protein